MLKMRLVSRSILVCSTLTGCNFWVNNLRRVNCKERIKMNSSTNPNLMRTLLQLLLGTDRKSLKRNLIIRIIVNKKLNRNWKKQLNIKKLTLRKLER